jgi:hypothetical protein
MQSTLYACQYMSVGGRGGGGERERVRVWAGVCVCVHACVHHDIVFERNLNPYSQYF